MKKNTLTHVYKLVPGDRFYKVKDKSKKVYEIVEAEPKVTPFRTYSYWCIADGSDELIALKGNTEVVFLRHNEKVPVFINRMHRIKASLEHYELQQLLN